MSAATSSRFAGIGFWATPRTPTILQTEAAECGLACLAMIASHWGHRVDLATLRRRFSLSTRGVNLKGLIALADSTQLQARPLKVDLVQLPLLKLPCILHWDLNHFVVLKAVRRGRLVINDPAIGERRMAIEDAGKHFTGVALELLPSPRFEVRDDTRRYPLSALVGRIFGLKGSIAQLLLLTTSLQICVLLAPFYLQWIVDEALPARDHDLITVLAVGFLLLVAVQTAIGAFRGWVMATLSASISFQWLGNVFAHLLRLPMRYFESRHLGDIVSRFGSIQTIQQGISTQLAEGVVDGAMALATLIVLFAYSPQLATITTLTLLGYALIGRALFRRIADTASEQIVHGAKQQSAFMESIRGIQGIRLFNRTAERHSGWLNILADQLNAELRVARLTLSYQAINSALFGIERVVIVWLAAYAVLDGRFSYGMLFAYIGFKDQFTLRVAALVDKLFQIRLLRLHGERVADIVFTEPEPERRGVNLTPERFVPSLRVENVSFHYAATEKLVLQRVNLSIEPGECVAIVGPSGSGKTTLLKILLGLDAPSEGQVYVGGCRLDQIEQASYRELIGTVMQGDQLFSGSIADNICFFATDLDFDWIEQCARIAGIHDEIIELPMGYHTLVGDLGSGLSGGQQQRILLARALYKRPKILFLDEATSHLDVANERAINAAIRQMSLTRVIIAHRPETISMADRVFEIDGGELHERRRLEAAE